MDGDKCLYPRTSPLAWSAVNVPLVTVSCRGGLWLRLKMKRQCVRSDSPVCLQYYFVASPSSLTRWKCSRRWPCILSRLKRMHQNSRLPCRHDLLSAVKKNMDADILTGVGIINTSFSPFPWHVHTQLYKNNTYVDQIAMRNRPLFWGVGTDWIDPELGVGLSPESKWMTGQNRPDVPEFSWHCRHLSRITPEKARCKFK